MPMPQRMPNSPRPTMAAASPGAPRSGSRALITLMSGPSEELDDKRRRRAAIGADGGPGQDHAGRHEQNRGSQQHFLVRRPPHFPNGSLERVHQRADDAR